VLRTVTGDGTALVVLLAFVLLAAGLTAVIAPVLTRRK